MQEEEARAKAAQLADWQTNMIKKRETLIGQIVYIYSRQPFATDELNALAAQAIGDEHLAGRVMSAVQDAVNERITTGGPGTPYMVKMTNRFRQQAQPADAQQPATAATSKP